MTHNKTYIGISRDHSGSMGGLTHAAMKDYNTTVESIRSLAERDRQPTSLSVVRQGINMPRGGVGCDWESQAVDIYSMDQVIYGRPTSAVPRLTYYEATGGGTPLFDSIGMLIEHFESRYDANDPNVSFLIMAITDGYENASLKWSAPKLRKKMDELEAKGNWTFVFRVPQGHAKNLVSTFRISPDNILEWELTTKGVEKATQVTTAAFDAYYTSRSMGVRSTKKFFADTSKLRPADVSGALNDVSRDTELFQVGAVTGGKIAIKDFVEGTLGRTYIQGQWFYELVKTEKQVQDYKIIAIRDRNNGKVYTGVEARRLLSLPEYGTITLEPGNGAYQIFIQSTSVNRNLPSYSNVLFWPRVHAMA